MQRANELMALQQKISTEINEERIGNEYKVILDRIEDNCYIGRTEFDSPEVDNEVIIESKKKLAIGSFYNVKITDANEFDLVGKIC
jgi:ribosomal protein S12 methylthiotransferase